MSYDQACVIPQHDSLCIHVWLSLTFCLLVKLRSRVTVTVITFILDPCLTVKLCDIQKGSYKNAKFVHHSGHTEWVRQGKTVLAHLYVFSRLIIMFNLQGLRGLETPRGSLILLVNWLEVREGCTSVNLTSSPGLTSIQRQDMDQNG